MILYSQIASQNGSMKYHSIPRSCLPWLVQLIFVLLFLEAASAFLHTKIPRASVNRSVDSSRSNTKNDNEDDFRFGQRGIDGGEECQDAYGRTIRKVSNDDSEDDSLVASVSTATTTNTTASSNCINLDPLVVCGPSGVGKGTVIECLRGRFPSDVFGFSVSHTTRQPRPGEIDGQHYCFTTPEDIQRDIGQGMFVEHALVHGNYYGTSKEAIEVLQSENKITILDIDVQGVKSVKKSGVPAKYIFIAPPSMMELENRLRGRGTETEEAIERRLGNAAKEIEYGEQDGNFDHIFLNNDVEQTVDEMIEVLGEWFPQLKKFQDASPVEAEESNNEQKIEDKTQSSEQPFDFIAESDKMLNLASVRIGHDKLEVTDRSSDERSDSGDNKNSKRKYGPYVVDNEEPDWPHPSSYRGFGKTNPNIVLDEDIIGNED